MMNKTIAMIETDLAALETNQIMFTLTAYYLFNTANFNKMFQLLSRTKQPEFLALRVIANLKINRPDLAEKTLHEMRKNDEDNCLT